jgi:hypothetical protein
MTIFDRGIRFQRSGLSLLLKPLRFSQIGSRADLPKRIRVSRSAYADLPTRMRSA